MRPKLAAITVSGRHLNLVICPASAVPTAPTPSLSGGESQRLRIASRLRSSQRGALYVLDEPSTGLHPLDVATLVGVFDRLLEAGATIIVIDHDLDLLAAADHLIDMGPGGGPDGGHILAAGTPADVARAPDSATGPWLAQHLGLPEARQSGVPSHGHTPDT